MLSAHRLVSEHTDTRVIQTKRESRAVEGCGAWDSWRDTDALPRLCYTAEACVDVCQQDKHSLQGLNRDLTWMHLSSNTGDPFTCGFSKVFISYAVCFVHTSSFWTCPAHLKLRTDERNLSRAWQRTHKSHELQLCIWNIFSCRRA